MSKSTSCFLLLIIILLYNCSGIGPRSFHAPLFEEKGEKHLSVLGSPLIGADIQFDYAFSNKYFLMTDLSFSSTPYRTFAGSLGIRRYYKIGERGRFSLCGGTSFGTFGPSSNSVYDRAKFLLPYAGMNLGIKTKYFEPVLTARVSSNTYMNNFNRVEFSFFAWETAATLRFGGEKLKLHVQGGLSYPFDTQSGLGTVIANLGLTYRFKVKKED